VVYPSTRVVARSTDTSDLINTYDLLAVQSAISGIRKAALDLQGLELPLIEPDYHVYPRACTTVASALESSPAATSAETLRCVIEVAGDDAPPHGSQSGPVILVQLGNQTSGWGSPPEPYDALLRTAPSTLKDVAVDIFTDFMMANVPHLVYLFDQYIAANGFRGFGEVKANYCKSANLGNSRYGASNNNLPYTNISSHSPIKRDIAFVIENWELFALSPDFARFGSREAALSDLLRRKRIPGQLSRSQLERDIAALPTGAYSLNVYTPKLRTPRDLASEAGGAFGISSPAPNRFSITSTRGLWDGPYAPLRRRLVREGYVRVERFIVHA
jgi:hypothetical protein